MEEFNSRAGRYPLRNRRCLVTGGAGFIGSRVVERLRAADAEVVVLGEPERGETDLTADLTDAAAVAMVVRVVQPELVVHLAARSRITAGGAAEMWAVNVTGTANLLAALPEETGILLASSAEVYGEGARPSREEQEPRPAGACGISRLAAEQLVRLAADRGRRAAIVRPGVVYGPGQAAATLVPETIAAALAGEPLRTRAGGWLDLVFVDDVADGIMRALNALTVECPVFNLGTGAAQTVEEIVAEIRRLTGHAAAWTRDLPAGPGETMDCRLDPERARRQLEWRAYTDWRDGLARTVAAARVKKQNTT